MPFRNIKPFKIPVVAPPIYLPEVQQSGKGKVIVVDVCQSKKLPDSSTTKLSTLIEAGVPLKKVSSIMIHDLGSVSATMQSALDADAKFVEDQKNNKTDDDDANKEV